MSHPQEPQSAEQIRVILKPLKSLRGLTTEESSRLRDEDFDQAVEQLERLLTEARIEEIKHIQSELTYFAAQYMVPKLSFDGSQDHSTGVYQGQSEVTANIFYKLKGRLAQLHQQLKGSQS